MKWRTGPLVLLVILGGVGCSSSSRQEAAAASARESKLGCVRITTHGAGVLSLRLIAVGGDSGRHPALPGILRIRDRRGLCNVRIRRDELLVVPVWAGTYEISGRSPRFQGGHAVCRASEPVRVVAPGCHRHPGTPPSVLFGLFLAAIFGAVCLPVTSFLSSCPITTSGG